MKYLLPLACLFLFAGCQPDAEARAFFYTGWVHPEEGANERLYGGPSQPVPIDP